MVKAYGAECRNIDYYKLIIFYINLSYGGKLFKLLHAKS